MSHFASCGCCLSGGMAASSTGSLAVPDIDNRLSESPHNEPDGAKGEYRADQDFKVPNLPVHILYGRPNQTKR